MTINSKKMRHAWFTFKWVYIYVHSLSPLNVRFKLETKYLSEMKLFPREQSTVEVMTFLKSLSLWNYEGAYIENATKQRVSQAAGGCFGFDGCLNQRD